MNCFRHFIQTFFFILSLAVFINSRAVFADSVTPESLQLIKAYASAAQGSDLGEIKSTWTALHDNPEAVEYMRKNMPGHYYLFQVRGLYFQMSDIDARRSQNSPETTPSMPVTNEEEQDIQPEANPLPPNGEVVERSKNAVKVDNRVIAIGNPNQNRQDNKTLIDNRMDGFLERKFQKAPEVLAPGATPETNP